MSRHTKKVGLAGKWGTRYGAALRKQAKKMELQAKTKHICQFCGKTAIARKSGGIWRCKGCKIVTAGGCYNFTTPAAAAARATIIRLNKLAAEAATKDE